MVFNFLFKISLEIEITNYQSNLPFEVQICTKPEENGKVNAAKIRTFYAIDTKYTRKTHSKQPITKTNSKQLKSQTDMQGCKHYKLKKHPSFSDCHCN